MARSLNATDFPHLDGPVRASWAPIFVEVLPGSGERLAIGVVAANTEGFFVARANRWDRLTCFYGATGETIQFVGEAALDAFEMSLADEGLRVLRDPSWLFASVALGEIRDGIGNSLEEIANQWLSFSSSLCDQPRAAAGSSSTLIGIDAQDQLASIASVRDRLPKLVYDYVVERQPKLSKAFNEASVQVAQGRPRRRSHEVSIDFYGSKIVANLGTLAAGGIGSSVERLKRKMWDLKVARDRHGSALLRLDHEMLVQHPANDDPQLSQRQLENLHEALDELERQADLEQLRLRPLTSVREIGEHILRSEAA